jgi:hypothetical protein
LEESWVFSTSFSAPSPEIPPTFKSLIDLEVAVAVAVAVAVLGEVLVMLEVMLEMGQGGVISGE